MIEIWPFGPVEESAMAAFEKELGLPLPHEYRDWLLTVGGGRVAEIYEVENGILEHFLTFTDDFGNDLVGRRRSRDGFQSWVPAEFLVIASGSGGSVSVKLSDPDSGSIWWADYDQAVDDVGSSEDPDSEEPQPQIMRRLTDSLAEFLTTYPTC